jgi:hypothetical protein
MTEAGAIEDISDFPAVQQLARALWRGDPSRRGAAVFVGAGFSLNADLSAADALRPPLWSDLADEMATRLYPHAPAPCDPLRLAEEYRAYLGQTALDEFIRTRVSDDAWRPGPLHRLLLELPWSEVLTTNWDTLLERAARDISAHYYEDVRTTADLAHARAPRIVKLHGSLGTSEHFIVAEEDYRTYPTRFAAFVNLARQVFIENELCLLGFSGDDPNFLQWSGWVRDELGGNARRIYLVGDLELGPAKRKLLEARNVAPIDLARSVEKYDDRDERHAAATRLFLDFLAKAKPAPVHNWRPAAHSAYGFVPNSPEEWKKRHKDDEYAASLLEKAAVVWKADRESHPRWLICPEDTRRALRHETDQVPWPTDARLAKLNPGRQSEVLYELAWRHTTALWPIDTGLAGLLATVADPAQPCGLGRRRQLEVAATLLRAARKAGDDEAFERWAGVLELYAEPDMDLRAEAAYQRGLRARDRLDFDTVVFDQDALCGVRDPAWRLRQASLHCERGEFSEASRLIGEALNELNKRQRENRASLWVRSRRAWAQYLARATRLDRFGAGAEDGWPLEFQEARCDPRQEIEAIEGETQKALRERREEEVAVVPLFKPGHYKDSSQTVRFRSSTVVDPAETLDHLAEVVGLPIRMAHVSLLGTIAKDTAELAFDPAAPSLFWYLRLFRAVHSRSDPLIDRYLGRVGVARLPLDVATALTGKITSAIAFWRSRVRKGRGDGKQDTFAVERLCLFIVVLSRLTARQDAQSARASFDLAMDLAVDPALTHVWEFEPIGLLAEHAAQAVPPDHRSDIVLKALLFPLSSEKGVDRRFGWPNPVAWLGDIRAVRPQDDAHWGDRIDELIKAAGAGLPERSEAAIRLGYLADSGALTDGERASFARAVWSESDGVEPALPAGTGLLPHIFALIPETDGVDVKAVVRTRLFERDDVANVGDRLYAIVAATSRKIEAIQPTREQALRMFGRMTAWRPPEVELGPLSAALSQGNIDRERRLIGQALALAVAPALSAEDRTEQRADALLALINMAGVETAIAALPYFICSAGESGLRQAVVQRIRLGFVGRSPDEVSGAAAAIETWVKSARQNHSPDLPRQLIEQVITAVEMRREIGLSTLVWCARRLVEEKALTPDDKGRLGAALGDLLVETAYERVDPRSWTAVTVSLVRAECVRLAQALRAEDSVMTETDAWLEAAAVDTLPEVRFLVANDPIQPDPH